MAFCYPNEKISIAEGQQFAQQQRVSAVQALRATWPNGTILYLKSGSPKLMVDWCRDDGMVSVCWFDSDLHVQRDAFPPELLQTEAA